MNLSSNSPKNILITGAAGFIGINLTIALLESDPHVHIYAVDNQCVSCNPTGKLLSYFTKDRAPIPLTMTKALALLEQRYHYQQWDIVTNMESLQEEWSPTRVPIQEIYHLASIASPPKYKKFPIETMNVNVIGTRNMLEFAVDHGASFLLTSTSEVYGEPLVHPQSESYYGNVNVVGERSCYDESKRCAETYVFEYRRRFHGNFKIARLFNTYGPYMDFNDGRIITNLVRQVIREKPITIYGDGTQTRSFCYVTDMVRGLMALMASPTEMGPMNLGNPNTECSILELVRLMREEICSIRYNFPPVIFYPRTENDPTIRRPDIRLAQERLQFVPVVGLKEGLKRMWHHFFSRGE